MLGLAAGDALGTTLEFRSPGSFEPLTDMVGGGPFGLEPGQWTDDTCMALCLAESLIERRGFDAGDQMQRYLAWWRDGHLSSTGLCFDIGNTVSGALARFERSGEPFSGSTDPRSAGNGSLMRLAPIPLAYRMSPELALRYAVDGSRTTHGARTCLDACRYYSALIIGALEGAPKEELLSPRYAPSGWAWETAPLDGAIDAIALGSFKDKQPPAFRGTGYVVESMEAALWAFHHSGSFREGALMAVNLGDDADTTGAIYGQLAGAYYGEDGIPEDWRRRIAMRDRIEEMAERLLGLSRELGG
jgi:ADP-ribosylglycohydrolase